MAYKSILDAAISQIGVKESPAGSNNVKYNTWYYGREVSGAAYPWCAVFVSWCFYATGIYDRLDGLANKAGCDPYMRWAKQKGYWSTTPKVGALVLFDWDHDGSADHIGIVEGIKNKLIHTVEGNTAIGNDSNGGEVMRRTRYPSDILGYIHIDGNAPSGFTIYGEGIVHGLRVYSKPDANAPLDEIIPAGEKLYCFSSNTNNGWLWWAVDETRTRWVRARGLKDRVGYVKEVDIVYGEGAVASKTGVRIHYAPRMNATTEEVIPYATILYCYGTHNADGYEWWAVNPDKTKWCRKTSLDHRKGYKEIRERNV